MSKHLVLAGAGHAHMTTLKNLDILTGLGYKVTVISPDPYHYYSGMGPGVLSEIYEPADARFHVKQMTLDREGVFVQDRVVQIDPERQIVCTAGGEAIEYDAVSFNTGSYVPHPEFAENNPHEDFLFPVKPIANLLVARQKLTDLFEIKTPKVLVGGGGAAGVEIAANVRALAEKHGRDVEIMLVAGGALLAQFDPRFREKAREMLADLRINLLERDRVVGICGNCVNLLSGVSIQCDLSFMALGVVPSPIFKKSGLPVGDDGGLLVNEYLQSVAYPNIFGGGDCIEFQPRRLPKVGVYAVRQNPFLFGNLHNFLEEKRLDKFIPQSKFLLILNMGGGVGLMRWKNLVLKGRAAFQYKNMLDKTFMRTFQVSGERG